MITDDEVESLRIGAAEAGDDEQLVICMIALEGAVENYEERFGGGGLSIPVPARRRLAKMTQEEARAECERAIDEARAAV